ncbi:DUF222 domain-containing protein [bacterium]|nr:DUF222 domain-containing protein [bacterium]
MFDSVTVGSIPAHLDEMPPGPALGGFLASIDVDRIPGHDRVVVLRALQRQASHLQAGVYAAMAAISDHMETTEFPGDPELSWPAAATEIGTALRLTRRSADDELDLAVRLRHRLPRVWESLASGAIDRPRARVIVHGTDHLDGDATRTVVDAVIDVAPTLTTGQLAARLRRLAIQTDPSAARDRYFDALDGRRVVTESSPDGTAHLLGVDLPPDRVASVTRRIDRLARELGRDGDSRTMDQRRADVYLDLLAGCHRDGKGGVVELRVDLETLAGLADAPGDLAGYGPVIADIACQVAKVYPRAEWRFTVADSGAGAPLLDGTTRRRPTTAQRRRVEARDRTCIFPGCRMPARQCDLDHRTPWAHSHHTAASGLDSLCRYHHITVRHRIGWAHRPLPDGDHLWTGPLGHRYTTSGRPP